MIRINPEVASMPWQHLIEEIAIILNQDSDTLEKNIEYYQSLRVNPVSDPKKLHNIYNKLIRDQQRFYYFTEIYFRLQNISLVNMMNGIEEVFRQQEQITGKHDDDFVIYYRKFNQKSQVYYMPL